MCLKQKIAAQREITAVCYNGRLLWVLCCCCGNQFVEDRSPEDGLSFSRSSLEYSLPGDDKYIKIEFD